MSTLSVSPSFPLPPQPALPASAVSLTSLERRLPGPPMAMLLKPADLFCVPSQLASLESDHMDPPLLATLCPIASGVPPCPGLPLTLWPFPLLSFMDALLSSPARPTPASLLSRQSACMISPVPALSPRRTPRFLSPTHLSPLRSGALSCLPVRLRGSSSQHVQN